MHETSHQTTRLSKGRHNSPQHGACVMELASMLAGEPFSDHPRSVSPLIASFLRNYNDVLDDDRRQDLYAYASTVVGTAAASETEARRAELLLSWGDDVWQRRCDRSIIARIRRRAARNGRHGNPTLAARYALRAVGRANDERHAAVLAVLDRLIDLSSHATGPQPSAAPAVVADAEFSRCRLGKRGTHDVGASSAVIRR